MLPSPKTAVRGPTNLIPTKVLVAIAASLLCAWLVAAQQFVAAQDILRHQPNQQQQQQQQQQQNQMFSEHQLASIQLPPQLASLTPQQLHQLAQIRELQIQQQQRQALAREVSSQQQQQAATSASSPSSSMSNQQFNNQQNGMPLPLGLETPAADSARQTRPAANNNDNGAYHEAESELEGVEQPPSSSSAPATTTGNQQQQPPPQNNAVAQNSNTAGNVQPQAAASFEVNWNKCPQLDPSDAEKSKKTQVITKCLQMAPIPQNLTRENVENHREQIATCALKIEGWFDDMGNYKYDKAENEIRSKKLEPTIEVQVLKFHVACKDEANKKFPRPQEKLIDQVQFYQACMDYYISIVCEIEVSVDQ